MSKSAVRDPAEDRLFHALADPTRRRVLELVRAGPSGVGEVASRLPVSQPAVSQHLRVLREAGLVAVRAEGRRRVYRLDPSGLASLRAWAERMWGEALESYAASFGSGDDLAGNNPITRSDGP